MLDKDNILDNIVEYTANELAEYIKSGIVTFEELKQTGEFESQKQKEVKKILAENNSGQNESNTSLSGLRDDEAWSKVNEIKTKEICSEYLKVFQTGRYRQEVRRLKDSIKNSFPNETEDVSIDDNWKNIDITSLDALKDFIEKNPNSPHIKKAKKIKNDLYREKRQDRGIVTLIEKIKEIQTKKLASNEKTSKVVDEIKSYLDRKKITKEEFLDVIKKDHNILNPDEIKSLIDDEYIIDYEDLSNIGISEDFIEKLYSYNSNVDFPPTTPIDKIYKQSTEVYFWGIPSSGKTCALGAILNALHSGNVVKTMDFDTESQGYGYATKLMDIFSTGKSITLPADTPLDAFYEMGFDLIDEKNRIHPITCIDMAGELMRCMYKANAGFDLDDSETIMLDTMHNILIDNRSTNRKMHFFVIEYGAEDRRYEGFSQTMYLEGAVSYIKKTKIFEKETDAIYIMITKADKAKVPENQSNSEFFTKYIQENYTNFYTGLEKICEEFNINGQEVGKIRFSLGDVCFQNYCKVDTKAAETVARLIVDRSISTKGGKIGGFLNRIKK